MNYEKLTKKKLIDVLKEKDKIIHEIIEGDGSCRTTTRVEMKLRRQYSDLKEESERNKKALDWILLRTR